MLKTLKGFAKTHSRCGPTLNRVGVTAGVLALSAGSLLLLGASTGAVPPDIEAPAAVFSHSTYSSPIAISNDNRLVWVVNSRDDTVSVIRTDNNTVLKTVAVGDEPRSIALDPDNKFAFVANTAGSSVSVIKINDGPFATFTASLEKTFRTGAEPWNIVISPDGKRVFVANSGQDTITVINAVTRTIIGQVNLRNSLCNDPDRARHFQPRGLAVTQDNTQLYVTRFLSFIAPNEDQGSDGGKQGAVCRLNINTAATSIAGYTPAQQILIGPRITGFLVDSNGDGNGDPTAAFPNQLQSIVIRGNRAFLPNIAASPRGPLKFNVDTQAFLNQITGVGTGTQTDLPALNLHLGARIPEAGKTRLFFSNPWAIAFTTKSGAGDVYVVSSGSDLLVKLKVNANGVVSFTVNANTTRYIDLNDPADAATSGVNAGKNPLGIAINTAGNRAYVANFVSANVSIVNLSSDKVIKVVRTGNHPASGSLAERILVGAEVFFSSRGHFRRPNGTTVSTDDRLSAEGWQNCASCHFDGWSDGVVWQFGSGPRKSVNLAGSFNPNDRAEQKLLNYSAIFDEVEDFEANIRNVSGPGNLTTALPCQTPLPTESFFNPDHGLLIGDNNDIDFAPCVINSLAKANAGRKEVTIDPLGPTTQVNALTALRLWVQNAVRVPNGPLNNTEIAGGVPVTQINAGRALFLDQQCNSCHGGGLWSASVKDFTSPPPGNQISCELNLGAAAPPGSHCTTAPVFGNPVNVQYLARFLRNVGSFNLGVPGKGNDIGNNIGARELAAAVLLNGVSQPQQDALGRDYNQDGRGLGYNVQSLLGIFAVQPYMHNGACESLACVVSDVNHRTGNGHFADKLANASDRVAIVRFLESIDAQTTPFN